LGSQINGKNSIKEEIRLGIQAGNRSLFANKKLLTNKDLNLLKPCGFLTYHQV